MALLTAVGLFKSFDVGRGLRVHAVNDVSLAVERGECLAIIGESGSGKSTLGRIVLDLISPESGHWRYEPAVTGERIQAVFQEPYESLNPRHRILAIVREPLDINRRELSREERNERARRMLRLVGLSDEFHDRLPRALSGGQQQRVGVARALVLEPKMLVLDEPTSSLDVSVRAQILDLLKKLKNERSIAMLYISHDIGSVERIADRVAVMYRGQVMETGETSAILHDPQHPYTNALLSARLVPDPNSKTLPMKLQGEIPSQTTIPNHCLFAGRCPEEIAECRVAPVPMFRTDTRRESRCIHHRNSVRKSGPGEVPTAVNGEIPPTKGARNEQEV